MTEDTDALHFLDYWRVIRSRKEIIIAVFLVVVVTGFLVTNAMPKAYEASVKIEVKEEAPDVNVWRQEPRWVDPYFLRTQFEIIQSRPILEEVINRAGLDRKLSKAYGYDMLSRDKIMEQTLKILSNSMKVQQYRDTNLIEIRIRLSEPKETVVTEVAQIAQLIAEVYKEQRQNRSRKERDAALKSIQESLVDREKVVREKEEKLRDIINKYKLDVLDTFNESVRTLDIERLKLLESMRITVRLELVDNEATYQIIKGLSPKDRLDSLPVILRDQSLGELLQDKRLTEVKLEEALAVYGEEHATVRGLQLRVKELDSKISDQLNGLTKAAETAFLKSKAKYDMVVSELDKAKQRERMAKAGENQEYSNAHQDLERAKHIRDLLEMRHIQEEIMKNIPKTIVEVIEPAKPADIDHPVSPNLVLNMILSIMVGLGTGIALAYFVEYLDTSVKTIEEVEGQLGVNVLGIIPQKVKCFVDDPSNIGHAEAYRVLRTNIQFSKRLKKRKTLCVTSGGVGEGKSLSLNNLAYVYAQLGDRTLVVDADLHRPRQHRLLHVSNSVGLANVLVGEARVEDAVVATGRPNLDLLPSGKLASAAHGLLDTRRMKDLVHEFEENYDLVLFDSPPIIGVSDASMLVREVDGVLLVIQHRKYPLAVSLRARHMIENLGANLVGVVLNNINISRDYSYYYYHQPFYTYPNSRKGGRK